MATVKGVYLDATRAADANADATGVWQEYILRKFVDMLAPEYIYARYAEPAMIPKHAGGAQAVWNIPQRQAPTGGQAPTALDDITASGNEITGTTISSVTGGISDYGDWFKISDLAKQSALKQTLDTYAEQVTDMGLTVIERLIRNAALATTNFLHAGDTGTAGVTLETTDKLKLKDFPVIAGFFRGNNAKGWQHLSGDFALIIHPNVEVDLVTDVTTTALSWSDANKHVPKGFEQLINNHKFVGRFNGVSALRTTEVRAIDEDVSSYACNALARWGVGNSGLGKSGPKRPEIIINPPSSAGTHQPIPRYGTLGWTVRMVAKLLDANRVLTVYSAHASATP